LSPGDTDGLGEHLSNEWESIPDSEQRLWLIEIADRLARWLGERGVDQVVEGATGNAQPLRNDTIRRLVDSSGSLDRPFMAGAH